ncbi:3-isopropylmalate dehydratase small subunit [Thalassovita aquimarina]|uniref:3-isopropylmalate dehydratase n=1 Tax=Thalassovita aquimarina TaxID=2785917 RepID=A0ABS5HR91_9RHOB|nr:3-isopropylmalate dehydratase small subunit [Thalassovita aquimarina]MBR9651326.1 3-isopropylmalate dehydratase small subunit [Thalassovita aquimarina]
MAGWTEHTGQAVALPLESIDTDQLIPARFMSTPRSEGYGRFLLHDMRRDKDGTAIADMPLNRHPEASILVARRNFGSGSSREAAVYALVDFGFRAVIAPSFGDIFASNAVNNGLLPLKLDPQVVEEILVGLGGDCATATINLETCTLCIGDDRHGFDLPDKWRQKLMNGWDDIDLTRDRQQEILAFRAARRAEFGWAWPS